MFGQKLNMKKKQKQNTILLRIFELQAIIIESLFAISFPKQKMF